MILSRRRLLVGGASAAIATPMLSRAAAAQEVAPFGEILEPIQRNVSAFALHRWQDHFETLRNGVILSDTTAMMVQYWSEDESVVRLYPSSVPASDDLVRLGYTEVVDKKENPPWRPTPAMRERNPEWPELVPGGDPMNPLGIRALYLSWQYYRIHGTHDTRKIGRRSSNGCIGLYNEHILELYDLAKIGTQVKLI